jgi:hypothetical protein
MEGDDGGLSSNVSSSLRYLTRYRDIFKLRRLRNAAITTGVVALSQQLSGSKSPQIHAVHVLLGRNTVDN